MLDYLGLMVYIFNSILDNKRISKICAEPGRRVVSKTSLLYKEVRVQVSLSVIYNVVVYFYKRIRADVRLNYINRWFFSCNH